MLEAIRCFDHLMKAPPMNHQYCFLFTAAFLVLTAPLYCADTEQPLPADAYMRVTLIDRTKHIETVYKPQAPGELKLPVLGILKFTGVLPAEFAKRIKEQYIERGLYTAETLTVVLEAGPRPSAVALRAHPYRLPLRGEIHPNATPRPSATPFQFPDFVPANRNTHNA